MGKGTVELMDRLMVSALIELRSCERFHLLAGACAATGDQHDKELAKLYRELWASEHGHYLVFLELARHVQPAKTVQKRWREMLDAESDIIQQQTPGPRMHSWV
jgi:tRNA-(ms[2]io[6]A)-hydroxylase